MINNQDLFQVVMTKLEKCFALLATLFSRSSSYQYKGCFDYDPINIDGFVELLLSIIKDERLHIIYVDVVGSAVQKSLAFGRTDLLTAKTLSNLRCEQSLLHDCTVEGSFYLTGNLGGWVVFYDAESDAGVILCDDDMVMTALDEYIAH